jgi:hypothetical protein
LPIAPANIDAVVDHHEIRRCITPGDVLAGQRIAALTAMAVRIV